MTDKMQNPGARAGATGGEKPIHLKADSTKTIARDPGLAKEATTHLVKYDNGEEFRISVSGRVAWALDRLIDAGSTGCTPVAEPAPRWSDYIFRLRGLGVEIETIREKHGGAFPGSHGRYVIRCHVKRVIGGVAP